MRLAERGSCLTNGLWVREIRKLTDSGHQTAILATDYCSNLVPVAAAMFAAGRRKTSSSMPANTSAWIG